MKYKDMTPEQRAAYNKAAYDKIKNDPKRGQKRAAWLTANKERLNAQQRERRAARSSEKRAIENQKAAERKKRWWMAQSPEQRAIIYKKESARQKELRAEKRVLKNLLKALEAVK